MLVLKILLYFEERKPDLTGCSRMKEFLEIIAKVVW